MPWYILLHMDPEELWTCTLPVISLRMNNLKVKFAQSIMIFYECQYAMWSRIAYFPDSLPKCFHIKASLTILCNVKSIFAYDGYIFL